MATLPTIPESITVHLGRPDREAENYTLPFLEYIANVASSEIYPTWPESALRANIYAEVSFALNRVYTGYYRSKGYPFDITNSTAFDQYFVKGRDIFENIRKIAGELFNDYIRRENNVEPLFAQYCNGTTVTCEGLSQWGTVDLAREGYTPFEILTYYYGNDIELVKNAPLSGAASLQAPLISLRLGSVGDFVRTVQIRLNRISANYPSIPKILKTDGIFGTDTEAAVRKYQEVFNLEVDGIVGNVTWYSIQNVYIGVKKLNDLHAEGIKLEEVTQQYPEKLQEGSRGDGVKNLQYYLSYLSAYNSAIPQVAIDGIFGPLTKASVQSLQRYYGLVDDGVVGELTWDTLYRAYVGIVSTIPPVYTEGVAVPYGGVPLRLGAQSDSVKLLQTYLNEIAERTDMFDTFPITGYFGSRTEQAVIAFQRNQGLTPTGVVGPITWSAIAELYEVLYQGSVRRDGQYPGTPLQEGGAS